MTITGFFIKQPILHGLFISAISWYCQRMDSKKKFNISVIGLWHLGEVFSACLAQLGHKVFGIDPDNAVIENFHKGILPVDEPELADMMNKNILSGRLVYTDDFGKVEGSDVVWFTFDTPVSDNDESDETIILNAVKRVIPLLKNGIILIFSSQLRVGSTRKIYDLIKRKRPGLKFDIAYVPENLQLGKAVKSFFNPSRIIIGSEKAETAGSIKRIFNGVHADFIDMNLASAEMSKHALNAFLATSLSFIYDISDLCEKTGADVTMVSKALRSEPRIGPAAYLDASMGFSGGTLGRDLRALLSEAGRNHMDMPVIAGVWSKNKNRRRVVGKILKEKLGRTEGKQIGILGLTYKAGTPTLRRSIAIAVVGDLLKKGFRVRVFDPMASRGDFKKQVKRGVPFLNDPYEMSRGCHAIILVTPWPEFKKLNFVRISQGMKKPKLFFDARNFLVDREKDFKKAGLLYCGVGRSVNV